MLSMAVTALQSPMQGNYKDHILTSKQIKLAGAVLLHFWWIYKELLPLWEYLWANTKICGQTVIEYFKFTVIKYIFSGLHIYIYHVYKLIDWMCSEKLYLNMKYIGTFLLQMRSLQFFTSHYSWWSFIADKIYNSNANLLLHRIVLKIQHSIATNNFFLFS
jgi:hypothetical protein